MTRPKNKRQPLEAKIDLVEWIKMRERVSTKGAMTLIWAGCVRVDSHKIGVREERGRKFIDRYVPAEYRGRIVVVEPDA